MVKETNETNFFEDEFGEGKLNQYIITQELGQGAFGRVKLGIDENTHQEYAIKVFSKAKLRKRIESNLIRPSIRRTGRFARNQLRDKINAQRNQNNDLDLVRGEVAILKKLHHKNIIQLFEVLNDPNDDLLYMVFEMCHHGPILNIQLDRQVTPFSIEKARYYFKEMLLGIEYLHEHGIAHRDIKPDNLLLTKDDQLKIVDFGISEIFSENDGQIKKFSGSPAFMAPELLRHPVTNVSARPVDVWAMGVTLFTLVFGKLPFIAQSIFEISIPILNQPLEFPNEVDDSLKDLLTKMLDKSPDSRITIADIREHPWVTNHGSEPLISKEENLAEVVTEITDEDLRDAFKSISSVVNVWSAAQKWKKFTAMKKSESVSSQ